MNLAGFPHIYPPPGFTPFTRNGLKTLPAVAGTTTLETIQINSTEEGWVRWIGLEAGDWNEVFMTIASSNAPLRDYTRINVPLGNCATPISIFIPIQMNYPLTLSATTTGAAAIPVRWLLCGWTYAKR